MGYSINELIEMAQALSEGDFERTFQQHFEGELGHLAGYMDALRQNLKTASAAAVDASGMMIPQAAHGMTEISRQAEVGVNSILELVEGLLLDQERMAGILSGLNGEAGPAFAELQEISQKSRAALMNLLGQLSFQDVIRQQVERVQVIIDLLEKKIWELLVKFKVKINEKAIKEGAGRDSLLEELKGLPQGMGVDQEMVDELLKQLEK
ncbi:MAG: hypothetical protein HY695_02565 [Deltaproteobacteria bacterium]|nr:hypothetical protein [Deltaproteobacteria bacterium]